MRKPVLFAHSWSQDLVLDEIMMKNTDIYIKLRGFSPQANYTDRATAACRRS
jgi:hypothetical protein